MKILVACEFSGTVRDAFRSVGHDAISCDILEAPGPHLACPVEEVLAQSWDMVIAFPPCTHLSSSGALYWKEKREQGLQQLAEAFFLMFTRLECPWAIENPVGRMSTVYRKPDQIIQPWMFGHGYTKATCLWLNDLPPLSPTDVVEGRSDYMSNLPPSKDRARIRSVTAPGIAAAMAAQWG